MTRKRSARIHDRLLSAQRFITNRARQHAGTMTASGALTSILGDLIHWADHNGRDFQAALKAARTEYLRELSDEAGAKFVPRCMTCRRLLNAESPLARDCGGDCWGCVGEIEAKGGYAPSIVTYNNEVLAGHRPGPLLGADGATLHPTHTSPPKTT